MRGMTHLGAGLATAAMMPSLTAPALVGIALGSLLPDADSPKSIIGRHIPVIPRLIRHRTLTHTIWFAALFMFLYPPLGIGIITHIVLDLCNPDGVPILWPIKWKLRIPIINRFCKSGRMADNLLGTVCWVVAIAGFVQQMNII